jgi:hypothetical protein
MSNLSNFRSYFAVTNRSNKVIPAVLISDSASLSSLPTCAVRKSVSQHALEGIC